MNEQTPVGGAGRPAPLVRATSVICRRGTAASGTDGASVALVAHDGLLSPLWASDEVALALEERQSTLGEGPCVDAMTSAGPVLVDDLWESEDGAWPAFLREAVGLPVCAVFAFPVRVGASSLGTFELYRRSPGALTPPQLGAALTAADSLGGVLLGLGDSPEPGILPPYRLSVHQAAGMISVQLDVPVGEAMLRLRGRAFQEGRSINEVADDVVGGRMRFSEEES